MIRRTLPAAVAGAVLTVTAIRNRGEGGVGIGMARAGAIAQLGYAVIGGRGLDFLVFACVVVVGVTAGALGFVCHCRPRRRFRVAAMAVAAAYA